MKILQYKVTDIVDADLNLAFMIIKNNMFTRTLGRDRYKEGGENLLSKACTQFTYTTP